jgi:hypothetical protein
MPQNTRIVLAGPSSGGAGASAAGAIQAKRVASAAEFARLMTPDLSSPYLGAAANSRVLRALLRGYWAVVMRALS